MIAVEFKSRVSENQIPIPEPFQKKLEGSKEKEVRVIVLIDEPTYSDEPVFKQLVAEQFLAGYADSDSIYDNE